MRLKSAAVRTSMNRRQTLFGEADLWCPAIYIKIYLISQNQNSKQLTTSALRHAHIEHQSKQQYGGSIGEKCPLDRCERGVVVFVGDEDDGMQKRPRWM